MRERGPDGFGRVKLADGTVIRAQLSESLSRSAGPVRLAIRPERIGIVTNAETGGGEIDPSEYTVLDALLIDSQYIGTDTRYTLRIGEATELVVRVQNISELDSSAIALGQAVTVYWHNSSATVLDN